MDFYIFEFSSDLENLPLVNIEWTFSPSLFPYDLLNPFSTNVLLLYPLKKSENRRFSDIFRGFKSGTLVENGLRHIFLLDAFFFNTIDGKKKGKILLKLEEKILEIHKHSWLSITWAFNKSLLKTFQKSNNLTGPISIPSEQNL